jgi:hypothetical protein
MASKTLKVVVRKSLKLNKGYPSIGAEVSLEENEARRLLDLKVVELPKVTLEPASRSTQDDGGNNPQAH